MFKLENKLTVHLLCAAFWRSLKYCIPGTKASIYSAIDKECILSIQLGCNDIIKLCIRLYVRMFCDTVIHSDQRWILIALHFVCICNRAPMSFKVSACIMACMLTRGDSMSYTDFIFF